MEWKQIKKNYRKKGLFNKVFVNMFSSQYQVFYKEAKWFEITIKSVLK